jgi:hypothetical protein
MSWEQCLTPKAGGATARDGRLPPQAEACIEITKLRTSKGTRVPMAGAA